MDFEDQYNFLCDIGRHNLDSDMVGKVITRVTFTVTNRKYIQQRTLDKITKMVKDPLQPDKMAKDTTFITKDKNQITMFYKKPLIFNKLRNRLEEYEYGRDPTQTTKSVEDVSI